MSEDVVLSVEDGSALAVLDPRLPARVLAVRAYVASQLSPRSRQNALDALRRIARTVLGAQAGAEDFAWPTLTLATADFVRRKLYDRTVAEEIRPGTANLTLSHMRGIVRTMYRMEMVSERQLAIAQLKMVKNVPGERDERGESLSPVDEGKLRAAARALDGHQGAMLDAAMVLSIGAGLRREEVARVAIGGLSPGRLTVVGKGNKQRKAAIDREMYEPLDRWLHDREGLAPAHEQLFCAPRRVDHPLSAWGFWSLVRQAAHAAFGDVDPCAPGCRCLEVVTGPHDFRRTFVTRLLAQGFDLREVQVLAGHASPETTARYDKRSKEELLEKRRSARVLA